jgi:hypothetical protein
VAFRVDNIASHLVQLAEYSQEIEAEGCAFVQMRLQPLLYLHQVAAGKFGTGKADFGTVQ